MNLKGISKKFQEKFLGNREEKTPEEEVKEKVIEPIQDENTELTSQEIATQIIELLNQYPADKRKVIIEELRKSDVVSSAMLVGAAVKAVDSDEIPTDLAVELGRQASDKTAVGILENASMSRDDRLKIIESLADNKLKEDEICKELKMTYGAMKELEQQSEFAGRIKKIIGIFKRTDKINEKLYKIVAKNLAFMYHKTNGAMDLYPMEQLVPIHEMIRVDMPEKIEEEYVNLLKEGEENKFDLKDVKERLLDRMMKEVHRKAKEEEQPDSTFMKYIGEVDEEESQDLIKYVRKYNPDVSGKEISKILRIAKGEESESIYEPKRKSKTNSMIQEEDIDILQECIDAGLIQTLKKMSKQERKKSLLAINGTLEKRLQKEKRIQLIKNAEVVPREETPKVKKAEFKGDMDR